MLPLAVTQGEPAGIGPEITLKAWLRRGEAGLPPFVVLGDPGFLAATARRLDLPVVVESASLDDAPHVFRSALPVLPLSVAVSAAPGRPDPTSAGATLEAIDTAVALARQGRVAGLVTNPIAKHVLYAAGFRHPGHTEYLAALSSEGDVAPPHPVMMLWSEELAVVPVTIHIPLRDVPQALTADLIVTTGRIVAKDLRERFGLSCPRLAVAGLNPHAGENATLGTEDRDVIAPAVARLQAEGLSVTGPLPADTMFHREARRTYDAALTMYHDQALVPIKTIAFDDAVNVTLGLPFVRTSPDHGTAVDIAGRGIARPDSLIAALRLAARLAGTGPRHARTLRSNAQVGNGRLA
jgi:4-hydroxythreonine-4-phosphate dehydrogenase